jgi:hypothetical protein
VWSGEGKWLLAAGGETLLLLHNINQCCGARSGTGSARIRNFMTDQWDPELEVFGSDPAPELDFNTSKITKKMINLMVLPKNQFSILKKYVKRHF